MQLSDAQRLDWLRLIRSENVGPRTFRMLLNRFGGAGAALDALPALARQGGRTIRIADRDECERELAQLDRLGGRLICLGETHYPPSLRAVDAAPPVLSVFGDPTTLSRPGVAIVGSRNASAAGLAFTERMAKELSGAGYVIVSGLARGVDACAHRASRPGGTIAVLAGGLDRIYPTEHEALAREIANGGALVTEMPLGWEARGRDFPRRNRIVSGISLTTVVIEAALRSGSLITARFAAEQGREVFAVPGSPLDPRAEGANDLLRNGATLCTRSEDVLSALAPLMRDGPPQPGTLFEPVPGSRDVEPLWDEWDLFDAAAPTTIAGHEMDEDEPPTYTGAPSTAAPLLRGEAAAARILALLGPSPVTVDDLARLSGSAVADARMALLDLELRGRIERHGGDRVSLLGPPDAQP